MWCEGGTPATNGIKFPGTPLGAPEYAEALIARRMEDERKLLQLLRHMDDLQRAWLIFDVCAGARANHWIRMLPPTASQRYAHFWKPVLFGLSANTLSTNPPDEFSGVWAYFENWIERQLTHLLPGSDSASLGASLPRFNLTIPWTVWITAYYVAFTKFLTLRFAIGCAPA